VWVLLPDTDRSSAEHSLGHQSARGRLARLVALQLCAHTLLHARTQLSHDLARRRDSFQLFERHGRRGTVHISRLTSIRGPCPVQSTTSVPCSTRTARRDALCMSLDDAHARIARYKKSCVEKQCGCMVCARVLGQRDKISERMRMTGRPCVTVLAGSTRDCKAQHGVLM
jgi:hypothetical protein